MIDLNPKKIPGHIAIIMDGNGRWATRQKLPRLEGHKKGCDVVDEVVTYAQDIGVKYLTLYSFSLENWNRPPEEVKGLMNLLVDFLIAKKEKMIRNQIRLRIIGESHLLPSPVIQELSATMEATSHFQKMNLILALSYGSRNEMLRAFQKALEKRLSGSGSPSPLTEEEFKAYLDTHDLPDPDLLIRTSGEYRMSNFLLWQGAYTELYFTETLWPDFKKEDFFKAIEEYQNRERRFGLTSDQIRDFD